MGRTIGHRWPKSAPYGDFAMMCDVCGVNYRRSQLLRRADGLWACSGPGTNNDAAETSSLALNRENVAGARRAPSPTLRGGNYSKPDSVAETHYTTLEDISS